jgi:hypothetical protein
MSGIFRIQSDGILHMQHSRHAAISIISFLALRRAERARQANEAPSAVIRWRLINGKPIEKAVVDTWLLSWQWCSWRWRRRLIWRYLPQSTEIIEH